MARRPIKKLRSKRFSPTPLGFLRYRLRTAAPEERITKSTWKKWKPILLQIEELREKTYGVPWAEVDRDDVAFELIPRLYARCRSKSGGKPSTNTLRGRFDAAKIYFDFLVMITEIEENPCDMLTRPSSKANLKPFLEPSEDAALVDLRKEGHELAVYALARGAALREGEIAALEDDDVDFDNDVIYVRAGKTTNATRRVPMLPSVKLMLLDYVSWRDAEVGPRSRIFVRTRSGGISKGYVWKLTKAMAVRANVRVVTKNGEIVRDKEGAPLTDVTPHALRRTFITDFANRGVPTFVLSGIVGHASARITEDSYAMASKELEARQLLLAAGDGPLGAGYAALQLAAAFEIARTTEASAAEALEEVRRLRNLAAQLEQSLASAIAASGASTTPKLRAAA